jgi:hypothetical protein
VIETDVYPIMKLFLEIGDFLPIYHPRNRSAFDAAPAVIPRLLKLDLLIIDAHALLNLHTSWNMMDT